MSDRLLAVVLFAASSVTYWVVFHFIAFGASYLPDDLSFTIAVGVAGTIGAALVAAWVAPRLASDATSEEGALRGTGRGVFAGLLVTLMSFFAGSVCFVLGLAVRDITSSADLNLTDSLLLILASLFWSIWGAVTALPELWPAFPFGAAAGAVYYELIRRRTRDPRLTT